MRKPTKTLRNHPRFSLTAHAYLSAKGYNNSEIKAIWDADFARGIMAPDSPEAEAEMAATLEAMGRVLGMEG